MMGMERIELSGTAAVLRVTAGSRAVRDYMPVVKELAEGERIERSAPGMPDATP
jgi:hypothetical protein